MVTSYEIMKYPKILWYKDFKIFITSFETNNGTQSLYLQEKGAGLRWTRPQSIVRKKLLLAVENLSKRAEYILENGTHEEKEIVDKLFKDLLPKGI